MNNVQVINCDPSAPPNIGEMLTVNYLRHNLPNGILLVNYNLPDYNSTLEIDIVATTFYGVFLLEVKHWLGTITPYDDRWHHDFSDEWRDSPLLSIERKAKVMAGFLKDRGWRDVSVVGMVVLSKGTGALLGVSDPRAMKVFGRHESLVHALNSRDFVFSQRNVVLKIDQIPRLVQTIFNNHAQDAEKRVAGYRVMEQHDRDHYFELVAEDPEFTGRLVRIKQYDVPEVGTQKELVESVQRFKRDMAALLNAGAHPNLVMPLQFLRDQDSDDRYYLVMEWAGESTLAEQLFKGPIESKKQFRVLKDIASGLAHCHAHGVYHRNLSPLSIYLSENGGAKVGNFDFAKVPTISRTLAKTGMQLISGRHVAPEQALHMSNVDQRADIFSLGTVWYDMIFRPEPDDFLDRDLISSAPISQDGKAIMRMLLAESRQERPDSMDEVLEWLNEMG